MTQCRQIPVPRLHRRRPIFFPATLGARALFGEMSPSGKLAVVFETFTLREVGVAPDVRLRVRTGGGGPAVVLLHGLPRTHTTWYRVARPCSLRPGSAWSVRTLRGYGRSSTPPPREDHAQPAKRAMAGDIAALMTALGHDRFAVVGHDRGSYVALRTALDHPDRTTHLAVLDSVPIGEALARADARFARAWWHWFFFARPETPERVITADPESWYGAGPDRERRMGSDNYADFLAAIGDPQVVLAMLEDYRAGLGVDRMADDDDRTAGRMVLCPTLVAWSTRDDLEYLYGDVLEVWRSWARTVVGHPVVSGHHLAEEAPEDLAALLIAHLRSAHTGVIG